ncbi:MAG: metallophosphoesterase [Thermoproteota archaeon]
MISLLVPSPAALIETEDRKTLVIADLHIGWELALSKKGIHVTAQMPTILNKLKKVVSEYNPDKLLILGDVKHTVATAKTGEWKHVPEFFNELNKEVNTIRVVRGNHDGNLTPLLPGNIKVLPSTGIKEGKVGVFHGHCWPSPSLLGCETLMMGHVHPIVAFRDQAGFRIRRQVWVKMECNSHQLAETLLKRTGVKIEGGVKETLLQKYGIKTRTSQLIIMPAFNHFLGGRPLNKKKNEDRRQFKRVVGPILRSKAVEVKNGEIYLLDGTFLGNMKQLKNLN